MYTRVKSQTFVLVQIPKKLVNTDFRFGFGLTSKHKSLSVKISKQLIYKTLQILKSVTYHLITKQTSFVSMRHHLIQKKIF